MKDSILFCVVILLSLCGGSSKAGSLAGRVIGWGEGGGQDLDVATTDSRRYVRVGGRELTNVVAVATLGDHAMALKSDGTVVAWGWDENKRLLKVPPGLSNVTAISVAGDHNAALRKDGTVVAWGYDTNSGVYDRRTVVPAGLSNIVQLGSGTLALKRDGTIAWWGIHYGSPPAGLSNIMAIAESHHGYGENLALKKDGTVVQWPSYLVDDTYTMPPGLTNVVAIASGNSHALALKEDGTVVAWGYASGDYMSPNYGQMNVPTGLSNVVAIAGGPAISMALKKDGTVAVWGDNLHHQVDLAAGLSNITAIAASWDFCLAIQTNGTLVETNIPPATIKP